MLPSKENFFFFNWGNYLLSDFSSSPQAFVMYNMLKSGCINYMRTIKGKKGVAAETLNNASVQ